MPVRPAHGDEELRLRLDLALLGLRVDHQERDEEQEGDHLQRLEQHDAERIERAILRIITEAVHRARGPAARRRKPRSGRSQARTASRSRYRAYSIVSAP